MTSASLSKVCSVHTILLMQQALILPKHLTKKFVTSVGGEGDSSSVYVRFSRVQLIPDLEVFLTVIEYNVRLTVALHDLVYTVM